MALNTFVMRWNYIHLQAKFAVARSKSIQMKAYIVEEEIKTCMIATPRHAYKIESTKTVNLNINVDANGYGRILLPTTNNAMKITLAVSFRSRMFSDKPTIDFFRMPQTCVWFTFKLSSDDRNRGVIAKEKYRGMFEIQKSGDKTSSGEIGLDIRTHASPKVGQDQVSGGVSVPCWHATPVANILLKPFQFGNVNFGK